MDPNSNEIKALEKQQLKRARITAIILGVLSLTCIILFVFARIQIIEATRNYQLVIQLQSELERQKALAEENQLIAVANRVEAEKQHILAEEASQALKKSTESKK